MNSREYEIFVKYDELCNLKLSRRMKRRVYERKIDSDNMWYYLNYR